MENTNALVTSEKVALASHWVRSRNALVATENEYTQLDFPIQETDKRKFALGDGCKFESNFPFVD